VECALKIIFVIGNFVSLIGKQKPGSRKGDYRVGIKALCMFTKFRSIVLLLSTLIMSGCQSAKELHYFKSGENYYRLRINESSFASKARYLSGYFDEKAVEKYFSEMSQPDSGKFVEWVSSQGRGSQLVMILSTNSTSIAEQIGQLASNEELLENVAMLANKDKITQSKVSANEMSELIKLKENIITAGDAYFPSADTNNIKNNIKDFLDNMRLNGKGKLSIQTLEQTASKFKQD
jgi:hypothetical protein